MSVTKVDKSNFSEMVAKAEPVVVIDFYATDCPPCQFFAPIFRQAAEARPDLRFVKIDIDASDALAERFKVEYTPSIVLVRQGRKIAKYDGAFDTLEQFQVWLNKKLRQT
jgi:thioredoxin